MMRNKTFPFFFLVFFECLAFARPYRYYLDPNRAENILAGITLRNRLSEREWLNIIQDRKNASYSVRAGDNLWKISRRLFGDPWLWRKMWQVNQSVTNPHEIEVGRLLAYYSDQGPSDWKIPVVKLVPNGKGNDIDNDRFVNVDIKQRHRVNHFVMTEDEVVGEVLGSYDPAEMLNGMDSVYLRFNDDSQARLGQTYMIAHEVRKIGSLGSEDLPTVGTLMQVVGEAKLTVMETGLVRAELTGVFHPLKRGDKILATPKTVSWTAALHPPDELIAHVVLGEHSESKMFGQGTLVLLDKGEQEGMKPGFLFRVSQDTDPFTKSTETVRTYFKGEIQVVFVNASSSLGYILRNTDPIVIGDLLIPRQTISDPPPFPHHPMESIEID